MRAGQARICKWRLELMIRWDDRGVEDADLPAAGLNNGLASECSPGSM